MTSYESFGPVTAPLWLRERPLICDGSPLTDDCFSWASNGVPLTSKGAPLTSHGSPLTDACANMASDGVSWAAEGAPLVRMTVPLWLLTVNLTPHPLTPHPSQ